jgi:8-oxo-dGTP diphosphatase
VLIARNPQLKGFLTFPALADEEDWYALVFVVEEFEGELIDSLDEGNLLWVNNSELPGLDLWEGDRIFLPWLDKPGFFSGKFIYQQGKLLAHEGEFYGEH